MYEGKIGKEERLGKKYDRGRRRKNEGAGNDKGNANNIKRIDECNEL